MPELRCPNCKTVFTVDESDYAAILAQVRTKEFDDELSKRSDELRAHLNKEHSLTLENAKKAAQSQMDAEVSKLNQQIIRLTEQLNSVKSNAVTAQEAAVNKARSEKDADITALKEQLAGLTEQLNNEKNAAASAQQIAVDTARHEKDTEISALKQQLAALTEKLNSEKSSAASAQELAVSKAKSEKDEEISALRQQITKLSNDLEHKDKETQLAVTTEVDKVRFELVTQKEAFEAERKLLQEQVDKYKEFKTKMSTKMVGESLEQHCQNQFNRLLRPILTGGVYFEKDNDAADGTKGDYIYRETAPDGVEIISIMFEMKNEMDTTENKHKNEDFFKKLDSDRNKKNCEYAVLVSMLEADNDYYNDGIVDVSHRYPKMYVIRPQFFIPMITLLRNAAYNTLTYRQELEKARRQNIDITNFEDKLLKFRDGFKKNYSNASKKFLAAIDEIDKTIDHLKKIKENLLSSEDWLRIANDKTEDLTIKKLAWGNKTIQNMLSESSALPDSSGGDSDS